MFFYRQVRYIILLVLDAFLWIKGKSFIGKLKGSYLVERSGLVIAAEGLKLVI